MVEIGPQYAKDNPFQRRMRFHQSWYRARVLGVPCGVGPRRKSRTYYGSMLREEDGAKGLNFLTAHIFQVAKRRLAMPGGGVEEFRLFCNMLSSQPMCFNLFAPLVDDLELATSLMRTLFPEEIQQVQKVRVEYSPEPARDYLNDRTAFDAWVRYARMDGGVGFVGIETKLSEPFSPKCYASPTYKKWHHVPGSPWREGTWSFMQNKKINQLWRNHLLTTALRSASSEDFSAGFLLLISHPGDLEIAQNLVTYRQLLKPDDGTFTALTLDRLVDRWREVNMRPPIAKWLDDFSLRYLDLEASESEFLRQM